MSKIYHGSIYTQFALYEGGIISLPTLIKELKTYKLVDQYLFHTESHCLPLNLLNQKSYSYECKNNTR